MEAARSFAATASSSSTPILGCQYIARTLHSLGVRHVMGVVGIPVTELAIALVASGIKFYSFRNEQSASYAASCMGYLTQTPGVCLTVAGPGMIHALSGVGNAQINHWPLLLLSGAVATPESGMGAFQESPQLIGITPYVKYATRITSLNHVVSSLENALCMATYGRPGPTYVELPADILHQRIDSKQMLPTCSVLPSIPITLPPIQLLQQTLTQLSSASRPLVIIGKGAAYARAEHALRTFITNTGIPFLATPMGKGVVPDTHPLSTATSRSTALSQADVILVIGARLNWILHFGTRFASTARIIRVDVSQEDIHLNRRADVPLIGDARVIVEHMNTLTSQYTWPQYESWKQILNRDGDKNKLVTQRLLKEESNPMTYYRAYRDILAILPSDAIVVNEGANTMDIGRTLIQHDLPRHRLDAGTWATMGIGIGYAIAAQIVHPNKKIVAIQGDSAFGFSAMEIETCCRLRLPILFIIINNNGIYYGLEKNPDNPHDIPVTSLTCNARYEMIAHAFGGHGYYVDQPQQLLPTLQKAIKHDDTCVIVNVMIKPESERKKQSHGWLSEANTSAGSQQLVQSKL